jgi:hypothetical protein
MSTKLNWNFEVKWVGDTHILLSLTKIDNNDIKNEILMTVKEYAEFMGLCQEFNMHFKEKIDDQLIQDYLNG